MTLAHGLACRLAATCPGAGRVCRGWAADRIDDRGDEVGGALGHVGVGGAEAWIAMVRPSVGHARGATARGARLARIGCLAAKPAKARLERGWAPTTMMIVARPASI
jgi:hypothetical protein